MSARLQASDTVSAGDRVQRQPSHNTYPARPEFTGTLAVSQETIWWIRQGADDYRHKIKGGRHPILAKCIGEDVCIANDSYM
jgi:hypothetical protein